MQTLPKHHLTLKLRRLQPFEEWCPAGNGLLFTMVKGGRGHYDLGLTSWNVTTGDVLVLNSEAKGKLSAQNGELLFWEFSSRLEHLLPLFSAEEICMLQGVWENFRGSRHYPASTSIANRCHALAESAPPPGNLDHRSHVLRVAAAVLTLEFLNARSQRNAPMPGQDHLARIFDELSAAEMLTLSIDELAKKFCYSRRHLSRLFHQQFGCSVAALRMELRLLKAVTLLRNPSAKVITVAEQCGFNHLGLFNTCFKRRFGQSPGQWRNCGSAKPVELALGHEIPGLQTHPASLRESAKSRERACPNEVQAKRQQILGGIFSDGIKKLRIAPDIHHKATLTAAIVPH